MARPLFVTPPDAFKSSKPRKQPYRGLSHFSHPFLFPLISSFLLSSLYDVAQNTAFVILAFEGKHFSFWWKPSPTSWQFTLISGETTLPVRIKIRNKPITLNEAIQSRQGRLMRTFGHLDSGLEVTLIHSHERSAGGYHPTVRYRSRWDQWLCPGDGKGFRTNTGRLNGVNTVDVFDMAF